MTKPRPEDEFEFEDDYDWRNEQEKRPIDRPLGKNKEMKSNPHTLRWLDTHTHHRRAKLRLSRGFPAPYRRNA
jgi:hypothetical protein